MRHNDVSDAISSENYPLQPEERQPLELVHSSNTAMPTAFYKAMYEPISLPEPLTEDAIRHFRQETPDELTVSLLTTILLHSAGASLDAQPLPATQADKVRAARDAARSFNSPTGSILPDAHVPVRRSKTYRAVADIVTAYEAAYHRDYPSGTTNMRISDEIYDTTEDIPHSALNLILSSRKEIGTDKVRSAERVLRYIMLKTVKVAEAEVER